MKRWASVGREIAFHKTAASFSATNDTKGVVPEACDEEKSPRASLQAGTWAAIDFGQ